jgi:hypothetical protein
MNSHCSKPEPIGIGETLIPGHPKVPWHYLGTRPSAPPVSWQTKQHCFHIPESGKTIVSGYKWGCGSSLGLPHDTEPAFETFWVNALKHQTWNIAVHSRGKLRRADELRSLSHGLGLPTYGGQNKPCFYPQGTAKTRAPVLSCWFKIKSVI